MYGNMDPGDPRGTPGYPGPGYPGIRTPVYPGVPRGTRGTPGVSANVSVNVFSLRQCSVNVFSRLHENIGARDPGVPRGTPGVSANVSVNVFSLRQCSVNVSSRLYENIGALGRDLPTQIIQPTRTPEGTPISSLKK